MMDARNGGARTILVVEDDRTTSMLFRDLLEDEGYSVVTRTDIRSAREFIDVIGPPDLALIDYQLPDGKGTELCPTLRGRDVPCVVVSAHTRSLEPAMDVSADAWIAKPFETSDVVRAVRELLAPSGAILSRLGRPGDPPRVLRIPTR